MSSVKFVSSWPNLVQRQYSRSAIIFSPIRNVNATCRTTGKHTISRSLWSSVRIQQMPLRKFSSDKNKNYSGKQESVLKADEIENILSSGNSSALSAKQTSDAESSADDVQLPKDLTEKEFLEIESDSVIEKYAKGRLEKLSPEEQKRLDILKLFYDVLLSTGAVTPQPEFMTDGRWLVLLVCKKSEESVKKMLVFWEKAERTIKRELKRKEERIRKLPRVESYDGLHNKITRRICTQAMNVHYFNNLAFSMKFGQPLIYDFSFTKDLRVREVSKAIQQLKKSHGINKTLTEPFHMHISGLPDEGKFVHVWKKNDSFCRSDVPITTTSKDITEIEGVPREKLVYLSPDSPHVLKSFNHNDIYVIGGIVDSSVELPLTFAKAKELNLRSAKLPLDRYIKFQGRKTLTLNQVIAILIDLKSGLSMEEAVLKNVPSRFVQDLLIPDSENFSFVKH